MDFNFILIRCFFSSLVSMLKMVAKLREVQDLHWKEIKRKRAWCYNRMLRNDVNPFYIVQIVILKCHQNQCQGTLASLVNGMNVNTWLLLYLFFFFFCFILSLVCVFRLNSFIQNICQCRRIFQWKEKNNENNSHIFVRKYSPFYLNIWVTHEIVIHISLMEYSFLHIFFGIRFHFFMKRIILIWIFSQNTLKYVIQMEK